MKSKPFPPCALYATTAVLVCMPLATQIAAQFDTVTPLLIENGDAVLGPWQLLSATMNERMTQMAPQLLIQNVSGNPIRDARFYAEYFDVEGRRCMTAVFSTEYYLNGRTGPVGIGERRKLVSLMPNLSSSVKASTVKVRLLNQRVDGNMQLFTEDHVIRSPVTTAGGPLANIRMKLIPSQAQLPMVDLILAKVTVDKPGKPAHWDVLNYANPEIDAWFQEFVGRVEFVPASSGLMDTAGSSLVLVRLLNRIEGISVAALLPRDSAWVRNYIAVSGDREPPSVIHWIFTRDFEMIQPGPAVALKRNTDPNLYQMIITDSAWSSGIIMPNVDWSSRTATRKWTTPH